MHCWRKFLEKASPANYSLYNCVRTKPLQPKEALVITVCALNDLAANPRQHHVVVMSCITATKSTV